MQLVEFTDKGLFCRAGNFYIDPWKPVDKAIITHAHSDHAVIIIQSLYCRHVWEIIFMKRLNGMKQNILIV